MLFRSLKSVERYFGIIPSKKQTIKRNQFANHMKRTGQIVVQDAVPLPAVFVSYHLDGFMSDTSVQADILASAFGDGKSSRLYSHLVRDQHIASSVFCYADQREHASLLTCSATAAHPGISHQQLLDALDKEIQGLLAEPFSDTELEKAINAAGTGYAYHMQTNAGIADMVCNQTLFWNDPMRAFSIVDRYRAVTKNEMNGLIEGMIRGKESCTVSIIPS